MLNFPTSSSNRPYIVSVALYFFEADDADLDEEVGFLRCRPEIVFHKVSTCRGPLADPRRRRDSPKRSREHYRGDVDGQGIKWGSSYRL